MPERWERRLQALGEVRAPTSIDARVRAGSTAHDPGPSPYRRVAAGVVAFAVFIGAGAFAWRAFDGDATGSVADAPDGLPTLSVQLQSAGFLPDTPPDEDPTPKIDTTIDYGDLHEQDFTSTTPDGAIVDWVGVEDLTRLAPGPVVGSRVAVSTDGGDGRVLIGAPSDWPNFDQFERIDTLPAEPGEYVLIFAADYPEGMALTARTVTLVPAGTLQLTMEEGGALDAAVASASVDGQLLGGFLSTSRFTQSDVSGGTPSRSPDFEDVSPLQIKEGARIVLSTPADIAEAGLYATDAIPDHPPVDLREGPWVPHEPPGNYHLVVEAIWRHGKTGWGQTGTEEWARFLFPVEIVPPESEPLPPTDVASDQSTYTDPLGWTADYPSDWIVTPFVDHTKAFGQVSGAAISNMPMSQDASGYPGVRSDGSFTGGVAVVISHVEGSTYATPERDDSTFPLEPSRAQGIPGGETLSSTLSFRANGIDYTATFGNQDGSPSDLRALDEVIRSLRVPALAEGQRAGEWMSIGPAENYPDGRGSPNWAGPLGVIYVMRGPHGTYALDLDPDGCGEGENETWDQRRLQVLLICPDRTEVRYERDGSAVAGNPSAFAQPLEVRPVITAWNGNLLVNLRATEGGIAEHAWP